MTTFNPTFHAPQRPQLHVANGTKPLVRGLLISVLVHVAVLLVVLVVSQIEQPHHAPSKPETAPIQAVLYLPSPVKKRSEPIVSPNPSERADSNVEIEPSADKEPSANIKPSAESVTNAPSKVEVPAVKLEQEADLQPSETSAPPAEVAAPEAATNSLLQTDASTKNRQAGRLNLSPRASAERYFTHKNQQAVAEEAQQAAKAYRQAKNSPNIIDSRKGEDKLATSARPTKKVNCSSTTNKTLTVLSSFTGGTLKCTELQEHDKFIEARVAKKPKPN